MQNARGPDIYQDRQVTRQIYALYATVRPGNSGGPLLTAERPGAGVVFAAAVDNAHTGYALTAAEVAAGRGAGPDGRPRGRPTQRLRLTSHPDAMHILHSRRRLL